MRYIVSIIIGILICVSGIWLWGHYLQNRDYEETRVMMDTIVEIKASGREASDAVEAGFAEMERVSSILDVYNKNSEVSAINNNDKNEFYIGPELSDVLSSSYYYYNLSGGDFDISLLPLKKLWQAAEEKNAVPDSEEIQEKLLLTGMKEMKFDQEKSYIQIPLGLQIDFGAIAKGYAADCARETMKKFDIKRAIINAGGDIVTLGIPPAGSWKIEINSPGEGYEPLFLYLLENEAIATSGNYERPYEMNRQKWSHILNPRTGYPVDGPDQVSVIASSAMEADALATCIAVSGNIDLSGNAGAEAMIRDNNKPLFTDGFARRISNDNQEENRTIEVNIDGDIVWEEALTNDQQYTFTVTGAEGEVLIEVCNGKVRVIDSKCPNRICIKKGWIEKKGEQIICVPNHLLISIK